MASELKACPFAHQEDGVRVTYHREYTGGGFFSMPWYKTIWYVVCDTCDTYGPSMDTQADAIAAWNTRKESPNGQDH